MFTFKKAFYVAKQTTKPTAQGTMPIMINIFQRNSVHMHLLLN